MEKRKLFVVTWKHQMFIQAKSERLAKRKFDSVDLGKLSGEVLKKKLSGHGLLIIEKVEELQKIYKKIENKVII